MKASKIIKLGVLVLVGMAYFSLALPTFASSERFSIKFNVRAWKGEDIYIAKGATTSPLVSSGEGAYFIMVDENGEKVDGVPTSDSFVFLKNIFGATEVGEYYKIKKGKKARFKLDVIINNASSTPNLSGVQLEGINYSKGIAAVADSQYTSFPNFPKKKSSIGIVRIK